MSIIIRMNAARHDATVNGQIVDLSQMFKFKGKEGRVVPGKENNRVSSQIIADCQKRGMFARA